MPTCNIRIERSEQGPVKTGGMLRGNIIVQVSESVKADAVVLELGWYTHGLGSSADEAVLRHTFRGELLNSGRELTIPFAVQIPEGSPITYQGTLIKLDWRLQARVDLPWKLDQRAEEGFVVVAGERTMPLKQSQPSAVINKQVAKVIVRVMYGFLGVFLLPFLLFGLWALITGLVRKDMASIIKGVLSLSLPASIGCYFFFRHFMPRAVDNARLILLPGRVSRGEAFTARLDLPLRVAGRLREVTAELVGEEVASTSSHGKSRGSTWRHELARLPLSAVFQEDATHIHCEFRGEVPEDAAPTLNVWHNKVAWRIEARAKLCGVPDPTWEEDLEVRAERAPREETS